MPETGEETMRNKPDINENQCDKCGKIRPEGELTCGEEGTEWEGLALCDSCQKQEKK
jgi:MinD superfamily P-loop ATPase